MDTQNIVVSKGNFSWSNYTLDTFLAPEMSKLAQVKIPRLSQKKNHYRDWIPQLFLNSIFGIRYNDNVRLMIVQIIRRISAAFHFYNIAKQHTEKHVQLRRTDEPAIGFYYDSIANWEATVWNIQICIDLINKTQEILGNNSKIFTSGDGSKEERTYRIANCVKHFSEGNYKKTDITKEWSPLWLNNVGVCSIGILVSYDEIAELLGDLSGVAEGLSNPKRRHKDT